VGLVKAPGDTMLSVLNVFKRFDANGDGFIQKEELVSVLQHLDAAAWPPEKMSQVFETMDANSDQRMSYHEFLEWLWKGSVGTACGAGLDALCLDYDLECSDLAAENQAPRQP